MSNISLKRIQKEFQNMINDPSDDFYANPIKDDMFCWHFTIRGPPDTEFEGGLYHGIIKLPMSYPNRPPSIMFLTPNGRFDVNMDVCLSMTRYHKEEWQAAWTIRSMLEAIIAFFPVKEDHDAIGALDSSIESRKHFAKLSIKYRCDTCGPIAKLLKPIDKMINGDKNNNEINNDNKNNNNSNLENKNINNNKNMKANNVHASNKKDGDSSSSSSLASNQTGKFKFKRDKANSIDNTKKNIANVNNNKKEQEKEEIITNINNEEKNINIENNKKESNHFLEELNTNSEQNNLLKSIYDEIEYLDIRKSIQFHENKTNDEIEYSLFKKNDNNINNKNNNVIFNLNNLFEKENEMNDDEEENNKLKKMFKKKLLNEKDFCVEKLEENIKYIKYFSRKNYEEIRDKNKRKVMFVMIGIMVFILILYFIGSKYGSSINRILKVLLIPQE